MKTKRQSTIIKSVYNNSDELLNEIRKHYSMHKRTIQSRLKEFSCVPRSEYFYELAYCLLTPQSSAINALEAIKGLKSAGFHRRTINPEHILRKKNNYIRFHKKKTRYLIALKKQFPIIKQKLFELKSAFELREWLVANVKGIGYKEATHFLRNIGKNGNLTILDRHILKMLVDMQIIKEAPISWNKERYLKIESKFYNFSKEIGISLNELDLLFWSIATNNILK